MYEVVQYRKCNCGEIGCPGEKETTLFQHQDKERCINYMLLKAHNIVYYTEILRFDDNNDKIEVKVHLNNGLIATLKYRVQEVK